MDSKEVTVTRLKNKILSLFTTIKFENITLSSVIEKQIFTLDDNEVVENDATFILDIINDITESYENPITRLLDENKIESVLNT